MFLHDLNCTYIFIILFNYTCIDLTFVDETMYDALIAYSAESDRDATVATDVIYPYLRHQCGFKVKLRGNQKGNFSCLILFLLCNNRDYKGYLKNACLNSP